jgi:hypothetical protein
MEKDEREQSGKENVIHIGDYLEFDIKEFLWLRSKIRGLKAKYNDEREDNGEDQGRSE